MQKKFASHWPWISQSLQANPNHSKQYTNICVRLRISVQWESSLFHPLSFLMGMHTFLQLGFKIYFLLKPLSTSTSIHPLKSGLTTARIILYNDDNQLTHHVLALVYQNYFSSRVRRPVSEYTITACTKPPE